MGELMRGIDWPKTPVGPVESWPQSLKTALSVLLRQRAAVFIFWGPEYVQFYNDAYRPILGSTKHPAAMGQRGVDCWPEIWSIIEPLLEAVRRGESTAVEDGLLILDRNGYLEEGYYTYTYSPITDETGSVGGVFCLVYDTTERVIGERRLQTLRDLASRTVARDPETACRIAAETLGANPRDVPFVVIYLHDADYRCSHLGGVAGIPADSSGLPVTLDPRDSSSALGTLALRNKGEILSDCRELLSSLYAPAVCADVESAIVIPFFIPGQIRPAGFMLAGINPHKRVDASYRTFFELVAGQIGTAVAESRAYEHERQRAESLAELDRAKTAFFSNVSHEFRTPLTLILGPVEDLMGRTGLVAECRQDLTLVHRNALRLQKLVNTLLDFSRIEAGRIEACYEPTDVAALTADLSSLFRSAVEKAGLRFIVECQQIDEPVYLDREMWEKIVLNLLSNALKFTFEGEIRVRQYKRAGEVELSVSDSGIGIDPADIPRLFDRFHRIEGERARSQEGSGIGLALVRELTILHAGTVQVESTPGKGSVFRILIPLGSSHLPAERINMPRKQLSTKAGAMPFVEEAMRWFVPDSSGAQGTGFSAQGSCRIMIADDNADVRDYLSRVLGGGYQITTVSDGRGALAQIQQNPPDLVLADVMMPGLNGIDLVQAIRKEPGIATLPVILLSARAGEEARLEGLRSGADDYLVKPFSARELQARVAARLEIAQLRQQAARSEQLLRREAEAERERLRDLIVQSPALIAVLRGPDHIFELANQSYLDAAGRREKDIIGKPLRLAIPEIVNQPFLSLLDEVYRTGRVFTGTEMLAKVDRKGNNELEDRYFNFIYQPLRNAAHQAEGIIVHAVDVTEQVIARQRIEEKERELRTLADSIPQLAWMAGADGDIFWYNQRWYDYTGKTPDEMSGWGWQTVHDPRTLPGVLNAWRKSLKSGEPFEMEFPLRGATGEFRWFLTRVTPLTGTDGRIIRWFGTNTDITELKRIRDERVSLLEREREARTTAELLNQVGPTLLSELQLDQLSASLIDLATKLIGAECGILLHKTRNDASDVICVASGIHKSEIEALGKAHQKAALWDLFQNEPVIRIDDIAGLESGSFRELSDRFHLRSVLAVSVSSREGEPVGGILFGHRREGQFAPRHEALAAGIAAQAAIALENASLFEQTRRIETALRCSNEELRRSNKDLETFAYSASHDLQEPLRNIAISAQLIQRDHGLQLNDSAKDLIGVIRDGAMRMEALVRDLLAYTRATHGAKTPQPPADGNAVLKSVLESLDTSVRENSAVITADPLPTLQMHEAHLSLLLQNLLGNALKYRRSEPPRIHISATRNDGRWTLAVSDNGIGIEPQYREYVFGLFKRLQNRNNAGSGVGLAICQRIVEQYGGRIWADSVPDRHGTVFSCTIPDQEFNASADPRNESPISQSAGRSGR